MKTASYKILISISVAMLFMACNKEEEKEWSNYQWYKMKEAPRDVNFLFAGVGNYDSAPSSDGYGFVRLGHGESDQTHFSPSQFTISIQTSNTNITGRNTFTYPSSFKQNADSPISPYSEIIASTLSYGIFSGQTYEYRKSVVENLTITADTNLFGRDAGEDLSDKFDIVLFYMHTLSTPAYIVSAKTHEIEYTVVPQNDSLAVFYWEEVGNMMQSINHSIVNGERVKSPFIKNPRKGNINLKEWASGYYYAEPALYVIFNEVPQELPCEVTFTVNLKTPEKTLEAQTPRVTIAE